MRSNDLFQTEILLAPNEPMHGHPNGELLMVLEGELLVTLSETIRLKVNGIIFINGGERHALRSAGKDTLIFRCSFSSRVIKPGHYYECCSLQEGDARAFRELRSVIYDILIDHYSENDSDEKFLRLSLCYRLVHLLEVYFRLSLNQADKESRIKVICSYIEQNYAEDLTLQSLADLFHLSPAYLSHLFKSGIGENFVPYLSRVRMRHAVEELISTDDTVTEIALNNGFSSVAAFYTHFRRIHGQKPLEYRREHRVAAPETNFGMTGEARQKLGELLNYLPAERTIDHGKTLTVRADINHGEVVPQVFTQMVNVGAAENFRLRTMQESLRRFHRDLNSQYVRFWNVFPPEVYDGEPWSDYSLLDDVLEILQEYNMTPYIQIGGEQPVSHEERFGSLEKLRVFRRPEDLISACRQLFDYLARSFPLGAPVFIELRASYREDEGEPYGSSYARVFSQLRDIMRKRLPNAKLGGPCWPLHRCVEEDIIGRTDLESCRPDFLSFAAYPCRAIPGGVRYISDPDWLSRDLRIVRSTLEKRGMADIPIFISEWNAFLSSHNFLNDSIWKAGFTAKVYRDTLGSVQLIAHERTLDEYVRDAKERPVLSGNSGMMTASGLPKPCYHAFHCIRSMGGFVLAREDGCVVTSLGRHIVRALIYNYKPLNYKFYKNDASAPEPAGLRQFVQDLAPRSFQLELTGMEEGTYRIKVFSISESHGSILDEWLRKDCFPIRPQEQLMISAGSTPDLRMYTAQTVNGVLSMEFTLEPMEILSFEAAYDRNDIN